MMPGHCLPLSRGYIHVYHHYFPISFSLKPLGQNQIECGAFLESGDIYFVKIVLGHMIKMAAMLIYGETFKNLQNLESYDLET